jgi:hypothetical protein
MNTHQALVIEDIEIAQLTADRARLRADEADVALCEEHLDYAGGHCPGCGERVSPGGNTAYDFRYCDFPYCGCPGARLCDAPEGASDRAYIQNVEGMWDGNGREQRAARLSLLIGETTIGEPLTEAQFQAEVQKLAETLPLLKKILSACGWAGVPAHLKEEVYSRLRLHPIGDGYQRMGRENTEDKTHD